MFQCLDAHSFPIGRVLSFAFEFNTKKICSYVGMECGQSKVRKNMRFMTLA